MDPRSALPVLLILLLIGLGACGSGGPSPDSNVDRAHEAVGEDVPAAAPVPKFVLTSGGTEEFSSAVARERVWTLRAGEEDLGILRWMEYTLLDGSEYFHLRYESITEGDQPVQISVPMGLLPQAYRSPQYAEDAEQQFAGWSEELEVRELRDGLVNLPLVLRGPDGRDHIYLSPTSLYEPKNNDVLRVNLDVVPGRSLDGDQLVLTLHPPAHSYVEQWGIRFPEGIPPLRWDCEESLDLLRIGVFNPSRWWSRDGMYYRTLPAHIPSCELCFYPNPAHHVGKGYLGAPVEDGFFSAFALVSLHTAARMQTAGGYWTTGPGSEWLRGLYGLEGGLYDTRWSTDAALFLLLGYRKHGDPHFLDAAIRYADFLVEYIDTHHFPTEGGYLVWDYADPDQWGAVPTHTSLNHQLSEMSFLYEMYVETAQPSYRSQAEMLLLGIADTREQWIREDTGDLWYARMPDGHYGVDDYPLLTLRDLQYAQRLHRQVYQDENEDLQFLIDTKEAYLVDANLPLH